MLKNSISLIRPEKSQLINTSLSSELLQGKMKANPLLMLTLHLSEQSTHLIADAPKTGPWLFSHPFSGFCLHAPIWKCAFPLLFFKSLFNWNCWGEKGRNAAYPCPCGTRLPAAAGHVWRSPGMGGITQIPKNNRDHSQIQGWGVGSLTYPAWRSSLRLIERLILCQPQVISHQL